MAEQGEMYAAYIEAELKSEYDRRSSLDARGLGVVTSSSALITLVFSVTVLVSGKDFKVNGVTAVLLLVALVLFVAAGVFGLLANRLRAYTVTDSMTLRVMLGPHWGDDPVDARNTCAYRNVITLDSLRVGNNDKSNQITIALGLQIAAVAVLLIALIPALLELV